MHNNLGFGELAAPSGEVELMELVLLRLAQDEVVARSRYIPDARQCFDWGVVSREALESGPARGKSAPNYGDSRF
jgi:hypothetical protein